MMMSTHIQAFPSEEKCQIPIGNLTDESFLCCFFIKMLLCIKENNIEKLIYNESGDLAGLFFYSFGRERYAKPVTIRADSTPQR